MRVHNFQDGVRLETVPMPEPSPGEVRVRMQFSGISFVDLLLVRGEYQMRPPLPFTGGSEFAGVVDALGSGGYGSLGIGSRVSGSTAGGAWAEYLCVPAANLQSVGADVPLDEAAVLNVPYGTALYALRDRGQLQRGETVLVLGASGGVGHAAVQLAKVLGARVIAAASSPAKRQAAIDAGADEVIDADDPTHLKESVKALVPRGVDLVLDTVGGDMTDLGFRSLGWGGRHLMVGFASGQIGALRSNLPIVKGASLVGVDIRQFGEREPMKFRALMAEVTALHQNGRIRPRIAGSFRLEKFSQAATQALARDTIGRILICP
ncbi:MAG: NADPH:quinone oxidoreductase family protein [Burkholderiales bacterium]